MAALDHLVLVTPDLAATSDAIGRTVGVHPSVGGSHIGRGSANQLLALGGDAYLEVIGRDPGQPDPPHPRPFGLDDVVAARLMTFAARVDSMPAALAAARLSGYDPGDATAMQRATADGDLLSWTLTSPPTWAGGVVPFLIDWGATPHPSVTSAQGATLRFLRVTHPEPARIRAVFAALDLAVEVEDGPEPGLDAVIDGPSGSMTLVS
ncbi:MAG: VOC family protein [Ilumatobacteraceae bacterium]